MSWWPILALAAGAYAFKVSGVQAGARLPMGGRWVVVVQLLPAALLAGLIVVQTIGQGAGISLDTRLAGVGAGGLAAWRGAPFLVVITLAALVTAALRALS
ncbi:MAG: AzlD domain-containing protein [Acidimicrobiia bacterium]|nr:AzlD domain-containing protein [Acidimicrobiia bacterium]